jgi:4-hydroxybenzoate polyprenyltransferase
MVVLSSFQLTPSDQGVTLSQTSLSPGPDNAAAEPGGGGGPPLAVDLDGTLLFTDTLFEALAEHVRRRPVWTLWQMLQLPFGIARVKARLQSTARLDIDRLPVNDPVRRYCIEARNAGRQVWLVTAADQSVADAMAQHFTFFHRAIGSDGLINNKGEAKARRLSELAPEGFEYIGDSRADLKVWKHARAASLVGGGPGRRQAVEQMGTPVAAAFERPARGLGAWLRAMRLHQWIKNSLIFIPALLAMRITDPDVALTLFLALPLMGLVASGTYVLNDLLDLSADRGHPTKTGRPFASGQLKLWQGFMAAPLMILTGLTGGFLISTGFGLILLIYLGITLAYSFRLKRVALADTLVLSSLYTLRLVMGAVLAGVMLSQWLMVFSMFLFVSLSLAKRHVEVLRRIDAGERTLANRGYRAEDAGLTLSLGVASATVVPLILVLYILESAWPSGLYQTPEALWVAPIALSVWLMRVWLLANRGELHDDPVVFALKDPQSLMIGGILAAGMLAAVLLPPGSADLLNITDPLRSAPGGAGS